MEIHYTYENLNWIILTAGMVVILHILVLKKSKERAILFANYETLKKVTGGDPVHRNLIPLILRVLAVTCLLLAISNLKIIVVKPVSDVDFVIAIDTSPTMLSSDNGSFVPNRLEVAKLSAIRIVDVLPPETKVGVVSFSGNAKMLAPLTSDKKLVKAALKNITLGEEAGTAIGDAVVLSTMMLMNSSKEKKVVVLITDGRSNKGVSVNESAKFARDHGVRINAIGVGPKNITLPFNLSEFNLTKMVGNSNITIYTGDALDEKSLIFLTNYTGGKYFYVHNATEMLEAFRQSVLKANSVEINVRKWAIIAGVFLLLIEWALGATKYKTLP